ncbi:MAG: PmoA family protein, partial [Verrucomicrobia bacterium]|nr:PmoA family protein [Verrucomicrobiota bacterium]
MRTKSTMNSVVALAVGLCGAAVCVAADQGVQITDAPSQGKLQVTVNGKLFTEYHYKGYSRPFLYPIIGPGGAHMTRNWPMKNVPGEEQDHPHHKSLWWAHGDINGVDFWSESSRAGKTVHE